MRRIRRERLSPFDKSRLERCLLRRGLVMDPFLFPGIERWAYSNSPQRVGALRNQNGARKILLRGRELNRGRLIKLETKIRDHLMGVRGFLTGRRQITVDEHRVRRIQTERL